MSNFFGQFAERILRLPHDPEPPPGDEASTQIFHAAPNYYKYLLVLWGAKAAGALFIVLVAVVIPSAMGTQVILKQGNKWGLLLGIIPVIAVLLVVLISLFFLAVLHLDFEKRWYVITDRSLRIREGVVVVREMTVTFANIQNISISQGPLQRALGIADLRVDTAGGGGGGKGRHEEQNLHTAWFRAIDNANEVRGLIQQRLGRLKDAGLGDHEERLAQVQTSARQPLIEALREVHREATALRQAVTR